LYENPETRRRVSAFLDKSERSDERDKGASNRKDCS
jgi:hypothetical protein